jgi:hypothetical protein
MDCVSMMKKQVIMEHSYPTSAPIHCDCQKCFKTVSAMDKTSITG